MNYVSPYRTIRSLQDQSLKFREPKSYSTVGRVRRMTSEGAAPKTCQWIEGEPRLRGFCKEPVRDGSPYCDGHHALCHKPALTDAGDER